MNDDSGGESTAEEGEDGGLGQDDEVRFEYRYWRQWTKGLQQGELKPKPAPKPIAQGEFGDREEYRSWRVWARNKARANGVPRQAPPKLPPKESPKLKPAVQSPPVDAFESSEDDAEEGE